MASQVFYRKYRPQTFAETLGQEHVTHTLLNALAAERISHAYLFCGPRGTGKTTTARMLAKAVNCLANGKGEPCNECEMCRSITEGRCLDVIEVDAASNRGINEIRDLREKANYAPGQARRKVYIIDEVHMLTNEASNALLKTLEEPPPHIIFVLATTEPHKLLPTILSRCQRFDFHRLTRTDIINELTLICEKEGITAEPEALQLVARAATGSMRDALNLFQQLYTYYGTTITLRHVQDLLGMSGDQRARELVNNIMDSDIAAAVTLIGGVQADGLDLRQFNRDVVEYLRLLLLVKTGAGSSVELTAEEMEDLKQLAARSSSARILNAVKRFGELDNSLDTFATLPLELAVIDSVTPVVESKPVAAAPVEPSPAPKPVPKKAAPASPVPAAEKPAVPQVKDIPAPVQTPVAAPVQAAKPAPAPEPKPEPDPLKAGTPLEQLTVQWNHVIKDAPDGLGKTPAAALLRSARPLSIDGDTITVAFKFPYHKEKMDLLDNQKIAEKIVSSFMGRPCKVKCTYEHEGNHLVKAALKLGGQVVDPEEA